MDNIIKTGEQDLQNIMNRLEAGLSYLLNPLTTAFSGTEKQLQTGLKNSKNSGEGMNGYVDNIIASSKELEEGFENFFKFTGSNIEYS